jgi:hypothetical protein
VEYLAHEEKRTVLLFEIVANAGIAHGLAKSVSASAEDVLVDPVAQFSW